MLLTPPLALAGRVRMASFIRVAPGEKRRAELGSAGCRSQIRAK